MTNCDLLECIEFQEYTLFLGRETLLKNIRSSFSELLECRSWKNSFLANQIRFVSKPQEGYNKLTKTYLLLDWPFAEIWDIVLAKLEWEKERKAINEMDFCNVLFVCFYSHEFLEHELQNRGALSYPIKMILWLFSLASFSLNICIFQKINAEFLFNWYWSK